MWKLGQNLFMYYIIHDENIILFKYFNGLIKKFKRMFVLNFNINISSSTN